MVKGIINNVKPSGTKNTQSPLSHVHIFWFDIMPKVSRNPQIQPLALLNTTPGSEGSGISKGVKAVAKGLAQLFKLPKCATPSTHTGLDAMNPPILPPDRIRGGNTSAASLGPTPNPSAVLTEVPQPLQHTPAQQNPAILTHRIAQERLTIRTVTNQLGHVIGAKAFDANNKLVAEKTILDSKLNIFNTSLGEISKINEIRTLFPIHTEVLIHQTEPNSGNLFLLMYNKSNNHLQIQIDLNKLRNPKYLPTKGKALSNLLNTVFPWTNTLELRSKSGKILANITLHQPHNKPDQQGKMIVYVQQGANNPDAENTTNLLRQIFADDKQYPCQQQVFGSEPSLFDISMLPKPKPIQHA